MHSSALVIDYELGCGRLLRPPSCLESTVDGGTRASKQARTTNRTNAYYIDLWWEKQFGKMSSILCNEDLTNCLKSGSILGLKLKTMTKLIKNRHQLSKEDAAATLERVINM